MSETKAAWSVTEVVRTFLEFTEEIDRVLRVCIAAVQQTKGSTNLAEAVHALEALDKEYSPEERVKNEQRLSHIKEVEELSAAEIEQDFPLLSAHSIVAQWSALESMMPRFVAGWLREYPDLLIGPAFDRVKLPVAKFGVEPDQFYAEIVLELERSAAGPLKAGVGRFDSLLDAAGLGGPVEDDVRRDLFEMSQVRNLIVHQFSVVDRKFERACPWLGAKPGTRLKLTPQHYFRYRNSVGRYVTDVLGRARRFRDERRKSSP